MSLLLKPHENLFSPAKETPHSEGLYKEKLRSHVKHLLSSTYNKLSIDSDLVTKNNNNNDNYIVNKMIIDKCYREGSLIRAVGNSVNEPGLQEPVFFQDMFHIHTYLSSMDATLSLITVSQTGGPGNSSLGDVHRWLEEKKNQSMVHICNGILFSNEKE